ncbi:MAG: hypothetical protein ACJAQW_000621 [Paracoccaceae bacterium]|jgi:hypothetical protein
MTQMGLFDFSDRYASLDARNDTLFKIGSAVAWEGFRPTLEWVWRKPEAARKSRAGRKSIDAVLMFKTLVPGALYNLSDDQIAHQVRDRLSFMRFLGLGLGDRVPDARTAWLYREALAHKTSRAISNAKAATAPDPASGSAPNASSAPKPTIAAARRCARLERCAPKLKSG